MHSMPDTFAEDEKLYRAVYPPGNADLFWRKDGSLSSAAFADPRGLSVDRGYYRNDADVINDMLKRFSGIIISIFVYQCTSCGAAVKYRPTVSNKYHCEIHGSEMSPLLSKTQRRHLAHIARIIG